MKAFLTTSTALLAALALAAPAQSQLPKAVVRGNLVSITTRYAGQPVAKVSVSLTPKVGGPLQQGKTNSNGTVSFQGLKIGDWTASASALGIGQKEVVKFHVDRLSNLQISIDLVDNQPPTVPANVTGRVNGLTASLGWKAASDPGNRSSIFGYEVQTSANAPLVSTKTISASVPLAPGGTYQAKVRAVDAAGNRSDWSFPVSLQTGDALSFRGRVIDQRTGDPIAGASVSASVNSSTGSNISSISSAVTDQNGIFLLYNLEGNYLLTITAEGYSTAHQQVNLSWSQLLSLTIGLDYVAKAQVGNLLRTVDLPSYISGLTVGQAGEVYAAMLGNQSGIFRLNDDNSVVGPTVLPFAPLSLALNPQAPNPELLVVGRGQTRWITKTGQEAGPAEDIYQLFSTENGILGFNQDSLFIFNGRQLTKVGLGQLAGKIISLTSMGSTICAATSENRLVKATVSNGSLQILSQTNLGYQPGQLVYLSDHSSFVIAEAGTNVIHLHFARSVIEYGNLNLEAGLQINYLLYRPNQHKIVIGSGASVFQYQID